MKVHRSTGRVPLTLAASVVLGGLLVLGACNDYEPAVYTAQLYRAADDCLEPYSPIGVVQVQTLSSQCLVDSAGSLYVSTVCAPYPDAFASEIPEAAVEDCKNALAAAAQDQQCDAGADAGADVGADAGT